MKRRLGHRGVTLIELLIVIVVIGILAGILLPALYGTKKRGKQRKAELEVRALSTAIRNYHYHFHEWPCDDLDSSTDITYRANNHIIMEMLSDAEPPMINLSVFSTNSAGSVLDPWGGYYGITMDLNYDDIPSGNGISISYTVP